MKRLSTIMMCLLAMMAASLSAKAQEVTITLMPGWTWISIPSTETMDFATALGSFTPAVGDRIKSQWGNATYKGNGEWRGQISEFYPGYGYKYYSTRQMPVSVTFNAQQPAPQVVVTTSEPMLITAISAMCGGGVTVSDGTYILVKGLCWAAHENPTTNDDFYQEAESGVGSFAISMTDLNMGTTYYVRAYAVTPNGTVYGDQKVFTTKDGIPTLTTADVTNITGESATCGGNITDDDGLSVVARGVCWSTSPNPTVADSLTNDGNGMGDFISSITGLSVNTTYYVRSYAITIVGTGYGEQKTFTTRDGVPTLTTVEVTDITGDSAISGGDITDDGGLSVIARGVCWSTSPNPTIADSHTSNGNGTGSFSSSITGLNLSTIYYVRAYATTSASTGYGEQKIFVTRNGIPTLTTAEVTSIMANSATCGGTVTDDGGLEIIAKGVCWSMNPNPTMSDSHSSDGTGLGDFVSNLTSLTPNATYYVRAYATNSYVTVYGNQRSFTTELPSYIVTVSSNPTNGGTATGGGTYIQGQSCSVQAIANTGYTFSNWTENANVVSTDANYTFTVNADRNLVANFTLQSFTVDVSASPSNGGSVSGGDTYNYGQNCTVSATANAGYIFSNWTENDSIVSTDANYTFTVNADRSLVANFTLQSFTINVSASPSNGGSVTGGDNYNYGQSCTVSAIANTGYIFSNWTENDSIVSTDANYTFTVNADRTLVANFTLPSYTISVSASPSIGGNVSGGGTYTEGQSCTVSAIANTNYVFTSWIENGSVVSTDATYTFTVTGNQVLVANFNVIYNGMEYIDLGLPSGALWAICNVGATTPEGYGNLYSWYYNFGNMPANMPTIEQWRELANNTTGTWTNQDGVNGWLYTASNGNTLFLPAAGYQSGNAIFRRGSEGDYWSKTPTLNSNMYFVWIFNSSISSNGYSGEWDYGMGCSVRQVLTP